MAGLPQDFMELKQRLRATWMAGDFGEIAKLNSRGAEDFVERLHLRPGTKVLDVACGRGRHARWLAHVCAATTQRRRRTESQVRGQR